MAERPESFEARSLLELLTARDLDYLYNVLSENLGICTAEVVSICGWDDWIGTVELIPPEWWNDPCLL